MLVNFGADVVSAARPTGTIYDTDLRTGQAIVQPAPTPASTSTTTKPASTSTTTTSPGPDLAAIQTQLNAATTGEVAARQAATEATSAARIANAPSALGYASTATNLAAQAQSILLAARAAAGRRDLQGTTIAAGQIATLAAQARGQADLANQVANTAMRSGGSDPFAVTAAAETAAEVVAGVARALTPGGAAIPSSRSGGGSGPRYVESGDGGADETVSAAPVVALPALPARESSSPALVYGAIAAVAYFWARG